MGSRSGNAALVCASVRQSSIRLSVCLCVCLSSISSSVCRCVCQRPRPCAHQSVSVCPSICLSLSPRVEPSWDVLQIPAASEGRGADEEQPCARCRQAGRQGGSQGGGGGRRAVGFRRCSWRRRRASPRGRPGIACQEAEDAHKGGPECFVGIRASSGLGFSLGFRVSCRHGGLMGSGLTRPTRWLRDGELGAICS
jgi:hypothetical protein